MRPGNRSPSRPDGPGSNCSLVLSGPHSVSHAGQTLRVRTLGRQRWLILFLGAVTVTGCTTDGQTAAFRHGHHNAVSRAALTASLLRWRIRARTPADIQGYASATSVAAGDPLTLYVSTSARSFTVRVFRMGWYAGHEAVLVRSVGAVRGARQPDPVVVPARNTAVAAWQPTLRV